MQTSFVKNKQKKGKREHKDTKWELQICGIGNVYSFWITLKFWLFVYSGHSAVWRFCSPKNKVV